MHRPFSSIESSFAYASVAEQMKVTSTSDLELAFSKLRV
ncbi:hypothetical protein PATSB16_39910 [Pandoraea thiooxydans]|nr:hypothetical protein PATSB16_39910 [Pandoraea thiooxydans]